MQLQWIATPSTFTKDPIAGPAEQLDQAAQSGEDDLVRPNTPVDAMMFFEVANGG